MRFEVGFDVKGARRRAIDITDIVIEGDAEELEELRWTLAHAVEYGVAVGQLLHDDGVSQIRVVREG